MGSIGYGSLTSEEVYKSAVTYQADVVIELKKEFYNNYTCSYFEIPKSRYIRHVLGHHPYKVENLKKTMEQSGTDGYYEHEFSFSNMDLVKKIVVLPSLHYRISASENSVECDAIIDEKPEKFSEYKEKREAGSEAGKGECKYKETIFGIKEIIDIMPNHFKKRSMTFPQIITVSGSSGLFKSDLALNALIAGIVDFPENPENGLIVRLGDRDAFAVRGVRLEKCLLERIVGKGRIQESKENGNPVHVHFYEKSQDTVHNDEPNKYTLKGWTINEDKEKPQLLEVTFKNGALLPEEFVDEICMIINKYDIRRVVFVDLKYIGSSYPFLVNSDTSGDLFLSAFVHIMRNYGMHVIMSSSESGLEASDVELRKAGILADAILTCTAETKSGRYKPVYITGEGLITQRAKKGARITIDGEINYQLKFIADSDKKDSKSMIELHPFKIDVGKAMLGTAASSPLEQRGLT